MSHTIAEPPAPSAAAPPSPAGASGGCAPGASRRTAILLGAATLLTMVPVTLLVPVLKPLVADRHGASTFWTHFFQSCNLLGAAAATPLIAMICDRAGSRMRIVSLAMLGDALLLALMGFAPTLATLLAARFFEGITHMLALSALMAAAADHAEPARRGRVMGVVGACLMFGTALGTRLGGKVPAEWSFFVAAGVSCFAALFVAALLREPARRSAARHWRDAVWLLRRHAALGIAYAYTFIDRFCVGVVISSFVLFLASVHGAKPDRIGGLLAAFLVPFAVLVYPAGRLVDRVGAVWPLVAGSAGFGLLMTLYGFTALAWMPVLMLGCGVLSAVMFAPTLTLCADLSPGDQRGAAFAGFNAAGSLGFLCGPLAGGGLCALLLPRLGEAGAYRATFVAAGAMEMLVALATLSVLLRLRREGKVR